MRPSDHQYSSKRVLSKDSIPSPVAILLSIMLFVLPWLFGGVHSRTQAIAAWVVAILLAIAVGGGMTGIRPGKAKSLENDSDANMATGPGWLLWILFGGIVLGCLQLVPVPGFAQDWLASGTVQWRDSVSLDSPGPVARSLYPPQTRKCLALLAAATAVCWLGHQIGRNEWQPSVGTSEPSPKPRPGLTFFLWCVAANGFALAFLGIVQKLRWNGKILWVVELSQGGSPFGPFVNRNNAGGYLNMCLAAVVGLLAWSLFDDQAESWDGSSGDSSRQKHGGPLQKPSVFAVLVSGLFLVAGILATGSRGSTLSMVTGISATMFLWWLKNRTRTRELTAKANGGSIPWSGIAVLFLVVGGAIGLGSWLGTTSETEQRWEETFAGDNEEGRLLNWSESLPAARDFWGMGSGLETYRFLSLPNQARANDRLYFYAENQYIQAFADAGIVGLSLFLAAILVVAKACRRLLDSPSAARRAIGLMGVYLLSSQAVASLFDFGLYIPSNTFLMAGLCGLIVGSRQMMGKRGPRSPLSPKKAKARTMAMTLMSVPLLVASICGGIELWRAADIESWSSPAQLRKQTIADSRLTEEELEDFMAKPQLTAEGESIREMQTSLSNRWDDANGHLAIGYSWMNRFRKEMHKATMAAQPWQNRKKAWEQLDIEAQLLFVSSLDDQSAGQYHAVSQQSKTLQQAKKRFTAASEFCPWLPSTHIWLAYADYLCGNDVDGHAKKAARFAGGNADLWYRIGVLHALDGDHDQAKSAWQKCLRYSHQFDKLVAQRTRQLNLSFESCLPPVAEVYLRQAEARRKSKQPEEAKRLAELGLGFAESENVNNWQQNATVAKLYFIAGNTTKCREYWEKSIDAGGEPSRITFAIHLLSTGKPEEAKAQLQQCHSKKAARHLRRLENER